MLICLFTFQLIVEWFKLDVIANRNSQTFISMATPDNLLAKTLSIPEAFAVSCKALEPLRLQAKHRTTGEEQLITVNAPFVFVGRSPAVGVRLDDPSISQCHAYLQVIESAVYCIDLGSRNGVVWDDGNKGRGWVRSDQRIRIGIFDVHIEAPTVAATSQSDDPQHDTDPSARPILTPAHVETFSSARTEPIVQSLEGPITLLGRHPACDLRVLDESLAYFQCALVNTSDGIWFVDTLSRQGAVLNGRNTRLARLRDGDLLEIGKLSLVFRIGAHSCENRLALRETNGSPGPIDNLSAVSGKLAEAVAGAFIPVGDMMKQFQQCFMTMAHMFTSMQQEHAMLVSEQMRQIQDLSNELREMRARMQKDNIATSSTPHPPSLASVPSPAKSPPAATEPAMPSLRTPTINHPAKDAQTLLDAHTWFINRLANKGQAPPKGS
jgi:pSer/pThr/pTyr-binding forkhead associated (FHA) protein